MTLIVKSHTFLAAAALTVCWQGLSHAQTAPSVPTPETVQAEVVQAAPVKTATRAASWQGQDVALKGQDVVSYFGDEAPVQGSEEFFVDWDDTRWRFSSEKNRDLFEQDPIKYVPEFGGYCPVALAGNHAKIGTITHYTVLDQKLYLNYNEEFATVFKERPDNFLVRASLNF